MISLINGKTHFICECCENEVERKATTLDYLGKYVMPDGWSFYRIFSHYYHYCDKPSCQAVLDKITESSNEKFSIKS
jgi:hypothetical protein